MHEYNNNSDHAGFKVYVNNMCTSYDTRVIRLVIWMRSNNTIGVHYIDLNYNIALTL